MRAQRAKILAFLGITKGENVQKRIQKQWKSDPNIWSDFVNNKRALEIWPDFVKNKRALENFGRKKP